MEINERLIALRTAKGISQYRLIELSGISKSYLMDIERGKSIPSIPVLTKLTSALGYTLSEFFNEDSTQFYLSQKEQEHLTVYRSLSLTQQDALNHLMDVFAETNHGVNR